MKADGFQLPAGIKKALAPATAALSIAAPAFAEGTGEVRSERTLDVIHTHSLVIRMIPYPHPRDASVAAHCGSRYLS
jgi:hypothetical protein